MICINATCIYFPQCTLAIEAVICWSLMERLVELARAWACSAFTMQTDACNKGRWQSEATRQTKINDGILQHNTYAQHTQHRTSSYLNISTTVFRTLKWWEVERPTSLSNIWICLSCKPHLYWKYRFGYNKTFLQKASIAIMLHLNSTFCPSPFSLSSSEHGMRITLLILPKDPTKSVTSCSDASFGMPVR